MANYDEVNLGVGSTAYPTRGTKRQIRKKLFVFECYQKFVGIYMTLTHGPWKLEEGERCWMECYNVIA